MPTESPRQGRFECKRCGETSVFDLGDGCLDLNLALVSARSGFDVIGFEVWMTGTCRGCVARNHIDGTRSEVGSGGRHRRGHAMQVTLGTAVTERNS